MIPRFLCVTQGIWGSSFLSQVRWRNLVRVECLFMTKLTAVGFCSVGGWGYFRGMNAEFENTSTVSGMWILKLCRWVYETLRLYSSIDQHNIATLTACYNSWYPRFDFRFLFYEICIQKQWGIKLWDLSWALRHRQSEFNNL